LISLLKNKLIKPNQNVKWYHSLGFQGVVGLASITIWLVIGIVLVMNTRGKKLVLDESSRLIEQIGNNAISDLNSRSLQIEALARTLGTTAENLPKSESTFKTILPKLVNFQGDLNVAGGGFWPEPYAFNPKIARRSFFWGRDRNGVLKYYDDYNQPGSGYHNEEWYVVARYAKPGRCFWSKSYMDAYSYQPMVTCTVPTYQQGKFSGVATIDLKLEGLQAFTKFWQEKTGGYAFILDRNNKFLSFVDPSLVKNIGKDSKGNRTEEFILASEFAKKQPLFLPISEAVEQMNKDILEQAGMQPGFKANFAKKIDQDSYQINKDEAELINAVIVNPLGEKALKTKLYKKISLENDFLLKEKSTVFIFNVPGSYWKFVLVQPLSAATAVASNIIKLLIIYLTLTILVIIGVGYLCLRKFIINPLTRTTDVIQQVGELVVAKQYTDLNKYQLEKNSSNEIGLLAKVFNTLTNQLTETTKELKHLQRTQAQLIQSEKMSSIGQMVAGIAHEINNPVNFIHGNITPINTYTEDLLELVSLYQKYYTQPNSEIEEHAEAIDLDFIIDDLPKILSSMKVGTERIREIVLSLRNFSRHDEADMKLVDIHQGIDSTLLILQNRLKGKPNQVAIEVIKEYSNLPLVECYAGQLNQVFMNILSNAIEALRSLYDESFSEKPQLKSGSIIIKTEVTQSEFITIRIADNGSGMTEEVKARLFDPFFTTKPVGQGTGLGLSISYQIIVDKHKGSIKCFSELGKGTEFVIEIPVKQTHQQASGS
jgi:signal transduction histidine kinase